MLCNLLYTNSHLKYILKLKKIDKWIPLPCILDVGSADDPMSLL